MQDRDLCPRGRHGRLREQAVRPAELFAALERGARALGRIPEARRATAGRSPADEPSGTAGIRSASGLATLPPRNAWRTAPAFSGDRVATLRHRDARRSAALPPARCSPRRPAERTLARRELSTTASIRSPAGQDVVYELDLDVTSDVPRRTSCSRSRCRLNELRVRRSSARLLHRSPATSSVTRCASTSAMRPSCNGRTSPACAAIWALVRRRIECAGNGAGRDRRRDVEQPPARSPTDTPHTRYTLVGSLAIRKGRVNFSAAPGRDRIQFRPTSDASGWRRRTTPSADARSVQRHARPHGRGRRAAGGRRDACRRRLHLHRQRRSALPSRGSEGVASVRSTG